MQGDAIRFAFRMVSSETQTTNENASAPGRETTGSASPMALESLGFG